MENVCPTVNTKNVYNSVTNHKIIKSKLKLILYDMAKEKPQQQRGKQILDKKEFCCL